MLPPSFRFGVCSAGFQVEGGFNGPDPGQPRTNWWRWEAEGRVEPSGAGAGFWDGWEEHLDRAAALGVDSFRLGVEWARCEPSEGEYDDHAFARYAAILDGCQERGLEPLVTLHHFTHPAWLGEDAWLRLDSPERLAAWVGTAADRLGDRCRRWVTVNEPNVLALQTYLTGAFPPGRRLAVADTLLALDHLLAAHVLAYGELKARQPGDASTVATNLYTFSLYELDRLAQDVLLARHHGVARDDLHAWLLDRRDAFEARMVPWAGSERAVRAWARRAVPLEQALPRTVAAVYRSPHERTLDVVQVDHYDPRTSRKLRLPGHRTAGGRSWQPARALWDDPPDPAGFRLATDLHGEPGLPTWVVENGLCNRVVPGRGSLARLDGWDRPRYLEAHLRAVADMVALGVPVEGYWHWCLTDNYEWGSYEPRFGLHGVDRAGGRPRLLDLDAMGRDSAGAYRRLIAELRGLP